MKTSNKTNADYMLKQALQRTEVPSDELLTKIKFNTTNERSAVRAYHRGRKLVVAAVVAAILLTFSTIAFAATRIGLRDIYVPSPDLVITFDDFQGTEEEFKEISPDGTLDDITVPMGNLLVAGFIGSPEYEAVIEWQNRPVFIYIDGVAVGVRWDQEADIFVNAETGEFVVKGIMYVESQEVLDTITIPPEELEGIHIILRSDLNIPDIYQWYGADSQADVDLLHEIIERHGLVLYGELFDYFNSGRSWDEFQTSIANGQFVDNSGDRFTLYPGYRWESGTFKFEAQYDGIGFSLRSSRKGTFDTVMFSNIDIDDFSDEWVYENIHGTTLILAQSAYMSFIIADMETAFIVMSIHAGSGANLDRAIPPISRNELENFADLIDFEQLR